MKVKIFLFMLTAILFLNGCRGTSQALSQASTATAVPTLTPTQVSTAIPAPSLATPEAVLQAIFEAANTGRAEGLRDLCDPVGENDGDTRRICALTTNDPEWELFAEAFRDAKIDGSAGISPDGNLAEVPFLFGPKVDQAEVMTLIKREAQWYLYSF